MAGKDWICVLNGMPYVFESYYYFYAAFLMLQTLGHVFFANAHILYAHMLYAHIWPNMGKY